MRNIQRHENKIQETYSLNSTTYRDAFVKQLRFHLNLLILRIYTHSSHTNKIIN